MKFHALKINSEIMYFGKSYTVLHIDPPHVDIRRGADKETIRVSFSELVTNPSFQPSAFSMQELKASDSKFKSIIDSLNEKQKSKVHERYEQIQPFYRHNIISDKIY
jgi:hypothetical protein